MVGIVESHGISGSRMDTPPKTTQHWFATMGGGKHYELPSWVKIHHKQIIITGVLLKIRFQLINFFNMQGVFKNVKPRSVSKS